MSRSFLRVATFVLACAGAASAQDADKAAAIVAFDEAQVLLEQKDYAAACSRLAESQRLDPQLGTLLHLAHCLELNGQTASAWSAFRDAAELAEKRGDSRQRVAEERAGSLKDKLSRLELELPADRPEGLRITRNGTPLSNTSWESAIPLDPGRYTIEASAPGYRTWTGAVEVSGAGGVTTLTIPPLVEEGTATPEQVAAPEPAADRPLPPPTTSVATAEPRSLVARKWPALVAGGVGLAGAAVWTVFGVRSLDARAKAVSECNDDGVCTQRGVALRADAVDAGNVATVGVIVTGVGLASAALLWLTVDVGGRESPTAHQERHGMRVGVGPGAIQVSGAW